MNPSQTIILKKILLKLEVLVEKVDTGLQTSTKLQQIINIKKT